MRVADGDGGEGADGGTMLGGIHLKITRARRWAGLCQLLILGFAMLAQPDAALAWPPEAGPYAYIPDTASGSLSVIDIKSRKLINSILVGPFFSIRPLAVTPDGGRIYVSDISSDNLFVVDVRTNTVASVPSSFYVLGNIATAPDGRHVYVVSYFYDVSCGCASGGAVSVIETSTNALAARIRVGENPGGIAVAPDGKRAYVTSDSSTGSVSVIDLLTNAVVGNPTPVGDGPYSLAVAPDGKRIYVGNIRSNSVSVIDVATNKVSDNIPVGPNPTAVAVTPDGKRLYVVNGHYGSNPDFGTVSVIDTVTNYVIGAPIPLAGYYPGPATVTPDGKFVYVSYQGTYPKPGGVAVIDTGTNKVVDTIQAGRLPGGIGIVAAPPGLPYADFKIVRLDINFGAQPNKDVLNYYSYITLNAGSNGIRPDQEPLTLQIGAASISIPAGSFKQLADGSFVFNGARQGVQYDAYIRPSGPSLYLVHVLATGVNLAGTANPVLARQIIGDDAGLASVKATFSQPVHLQAAK